MRCSSDTLPKARPHRTTLLIPRPKQPGIVVFPVQVTPDFERSTLHIALESRLTLQARCSPYSESRKEDSAEDRWQAGGMHCPAELRQRTNYWATRWQCCFQFNGVSRSDCSSFDRERLWRKLALPLTFFLHSAAHNQEHTSLNRNFCEPFSTCPRSSNQRRAPCRSPPDLSSPGGKYE